MQEKVYARSLNLATLNTECLEVSAFLIGHPSTQAQPLITKLNATSQVEVLHECTSFEHDFHESFRGDLLVVGLAIKHSP